MRDEPHALDVAAATRRISQGAPTAATSERVSDNEHAAVDTRHRSCNGVSKDSVSRDLATVSNETVDAPVPISAQRVLMS
ncbi:hypothetical protein MHIB_12470 [Mycolicibacter hiberniae]|uniref:Uncharacterized protein n=1 Tax=Mycolicibacter hiberniae TaxID=29314 RepID=A0A7I7WZ40_9MYCO|nr:hypothetical protein MHIB_12470 [Mycolicibacter hiberniae]